MWRRLFLFLFLTLKVSPVDDYNKDVFNNLCGITKRASSILRLQEWNANVKHDLEEAIYGKRERAQFNKDGEVDFGGDCDLFDSGRSQLCSFKGRGNQGTGRNGCFADSLIGTVLCICTPGNNNPKDLCSLGGLETVGVWSGWELREHEKNLFKKVWEKIKERCTSVTRSELIREDHSRTLKKAVTNVTSKLRYDNKGYFYLSGDGAGDCSGTNRGNICSAYKGSDKGIAKVPWADKINEAIEKLETAQATASTSTSPIRMSGSPAAEGAPGEKIDLAGQNEPTSHETHDQRESDVTDTQKGPSTGHSDTAKSRGQRSTQRSRETDTASLANDPEEDGTLITRQKCVLIAALIS
ncbi:Variant surface glycoprotein [Trypanosoma congolense IL3000]|uniref:Variant surface glycoprotein n=1 Tax=Trypanosoma congolense (strain IL3000) TaxID=1068625 RepID=F9WBG4_TRYCI|nr:Variant surface glycoprotein [Trypanosoma congolense IL3000]